MFRVFIPELLPPAEENLEILDKIAQVKIGLSRPYTEVELIREVLEADGIIVSSREKVTRRVIEAGLKLRVIGRFGVGIENVDLGTATERGIPVTYAPGINADAVSEHALALIFALLRKLLRATGHLKSGGWRGDRALLGGELMGSTVGIIGFGRIGQRLATKLKGFEVRILAYDPYLSKEKAPDLGANFVSLETLLKESDIISVHCALTEETRHLIGERELRLLKPTAYLVNTARGPVIDEKALQKALIEGRLAGAGLDVFEEEPPRPNNPLLTMENVVATPHCGGSTWRARENSVRLVMGNVAKILLGELPPLENIANPAVLSKVTLRSS